MCFGLNLETIKFYFIKLATDFYQQPSYFTGQKSLIKFNLAQLGMFSPNCLISATTLSIITFRIMTVSNIKKRDTQYQRHSASGIIMLSVVILNVFCYGGCCCAKRHYAECYVVPEYHCTVDLLFDLFWISLFYK